MMMMMMANCKCAIKHILGFSHRSFCEQRHDLIILLCKMTLVITLASNTIIIIIAIIITSPKPAYGR